jgi:osmotically inducible lipoprotein OsmB
MLALPLRRSVLPLILTASITACGGGDPAAEDPAREIELPPAAADAPLSDAPTTPPSTSSTVTPTKSAAPAPTPAPARPPAPRPTAPTSRTGTLATGTDLHLAAASRVCTNTHKVASRFTATTTEATAGTNGTSLPAGATVILEVIESARGQNSPDSIKFAFKVVSVTVNGTDQPVSADVTQVAKLEAVRVQSNATQAGKVATGAAIGAVAGQLLGKNTKSTVAGAAVGAVAGGAVAAGTTDYEGCLPANGAITVALKAPLTLRA